MNPRSQQSCGFRPTPYTAGTPESAPHIIGVVKMRTRWVKRLAGIQFGMCTELWSDTDRNRLLDIWQIIWKRSLNKCNEVVDYILPVRWKGKRTVPLQPMQVVKCDQSGYPAPGSVNGPPCPGGYKYCELVLQVGGWATGRQPVTARKLDVRKHKLRPGEGQAKVKKQSWLTEVL